MKDDIKIVRIGYEVVQIKGNVISHSPKRPRKVPNMGLEELKSTLGKYSQVIIRTRFNPDEDFTYYCGKNITLREYFALTKVDLLAAFYHWAHQVKV